MYVVDTSNWIVSSSEIIGTVNVSNNENITYDHTSNSSMTLSENMDEHLQTIIGENVEPSTNVTARIINSPETTGSEDIDDTCHLNYHNVQCQICKWYFPDVLSLNNHIKRIHTEKCKICNVTIIGDFDEHLYQYHYRHKLLEFIPSETRKCLACRNLNFNSSMEVMDHMINVHNICRKFYSYSSQNDSLTIQNLTNIISYQEHKKR